MSRAEFTLRLKTLAEAGKAVGHDKFPLVVLFDSDVWGGPEGHQILKDICDNGMVLMFYREKTREERAL